MGSNSTSTLICLAIVAVVLAIVYQIAPGEPAWITELPKPPTSNDYQTHTFLGGDGSTTLVGRLYPPSTYRQSKEAPVIVMAHGLGLTQDSSLDAFIHAFQQAGFRAFTFDYATFGYSEGWPRHQVKPEVHVADLKAAVGHVRSMVPTETPLALWGTSMGAGHVLTAASQDKYELVQAVVGNVPHVKSATESLLGTCKRDPYHTVPALGKVTGALIKWMLSQLIYGKTTYIPLHGPPGSAAMMQNPGDSDGYGALITTGAEQSGWTNLASVGSILPTLRYRPYDQVHLIRAPTLLIPAEQDTLCPAASAQDAIQRMPNGRLLLLKGKAHFDVYHGDALETVLSETVQFFQQHLGTTTTTNTININELARKANSVLATSRNLFYFGSILLFFGLIFWLWQSGGQGWWKESSTWFKKKEEKGS